MGEKSLHDALKHWYVRLDDKLEEKVGDYVVDIKRGNMLVEIQTRNFSAIRTKLRKLVKHHPVTLVHPIAERKWIKRIDSDGKTVLSRRKSPKRGRIEDLFSELVYIPNLLGNPNFSLDILFIDMEEILLNDGQGSWRRRHWSIHDRRLLNVINSITFSNPHQLKALLPNSTKGKFTTKELAQELRLRPSVAQKMVYCLRHLGVIQVAGKSGRAFLYAAN